MPSSCAFGPLLEDVRQVPPLTDRPLGQRLRASTAHRDGEGHRHAWAAAGEATRDGPVRQLAHLGAGDLLRLRLLRSRRLKRELLVAARRLRWWPALRAHSITWSARWSRAGGIVRPSALAVFRLITN